MNKLNLATICIVLVLQSCNTKKDDFYHIKGEESFVFKLNSGKIVFLEISEREFDFFLMNEDMSGLHVKYNDEKTTLNNIVFDSNRKVEAVYLDENGDLIPEKKIIPSLNKTYMLKVVEEELETKK